MNLNQIIVNLDRALSIATKSLWIFVPILSALTFLSINCQKPEVISHRF
ncbi:MAG: hypothetical protein WBA41_09500 [Rivularia sp. (in: cyanobacteria)]